MGKNVFFFFFGYQGQRQHSVVVGNAITTYTPAELGGDFSHSVSNGPDPNVAAFLQTHPYFQSDPALASKAILDPSKINPVAESYIKAGLVPTSASGILVPNGTASDNRDEYTGKFDFAATTRDRISITLARSNNPTLIPFSPIFLASNANVPGAPVINKNVRYFGNVDYTKTISQNTLNDFHVAQHRLVRKGEHVEYMAKDTRNKRRVLRWSSRVSSIVHSRSALNAIFWAACTTL